MVYNWLRQEYSTPEIAHTSGTQFTGLTGAKVQTLSQMLLAGTKVQILTQRFLRPRYSVYWLYWYKSTNTDAGGAVERLRLESSHSSSDVLLDREPSGELAQEPLPLQPLALHVSLSALAARKLDKPSLSGLLVQKYLLPKVLASWYKSTNTDMACSSLCTRRARRGRLAQDQQQHFRRRDDWQVREPFQHSAS